MMRVSETENVVFEPSKFFFDALHTQEETALVFLYDRISIRVNRVLIATHLM